MLKLLWPSEPAPLAPDEVHLWSFRDSGKDRFLDLLQFYAGAREMARGVRGKPFVPGSEVRFNLSHSGGLLACAFTLGREVGVDVEFENRKVDPLRLADRFFARDEAAAVRSGGAKAFFRLWTRKEAYVKALGLGIAGLQLSSFSALPEEARVSGAALGTCRIWDLELEAGCVGALAVQTV